MTWTLFLDLVASWLGLASGTLFALGFLQMRDESIKVIASSFYDSGEQIAAELAQQRVDFKYGAFFLFLTFAVQLVSKLATPLVGRTVCDNFWLAAAGSCVTAIVPFSICAYFLLKQRASAAAEARAYNQ